MVVVRIGLRLATQCLLQDMSIRWLDAFVILLFGVDNLKAKLFVELNGAIVVDLHVPVLSEVDLN